MWCSDADGEACSAAGAAQQRRFDQELQQNVAAPRPKRHTETDLARALGDRDKKDVHDADAADQQRDRRQDRQ